MVYTVEFPTRESGSETVLQELNRRRVIRVAVAYVAIAFAVVEGTLTWMAAAGGPGWAFRVVLGAFLLGFPAAMVLAWDYDITPQGIVRTPEEPPSEPAGEPTRWLWKAAAVGGLAAGILLHTLR